MATFGRTLSGIADSLSGWREELVEITDPEVLRRSRKRFHPVLRPGDGALISGTVFQLTDAELKAADSYEVADYARREIRLGSGLLAWVYVGHDHA